MRWLVAAFDCSRRHPKHRYGLVPPGGEAEVAANDDESVEEVPADERTTMEGSELAHVRLRYKEPDADVSALVEAVVEDGHRSAWAASDDFRFAIAVAQCGLLLREPRYKGESSWKSVIDLASSASSLDQTGDRAGFLDLAKKAEKLSTEKVARGNRGEPGARPMKGRVFGSFINQPIALYCMQV